MANVPVSNPLANILRDHTLVRTDGPGAADIDFRPLVQALELEALYRRTLGFWAANGITTGPTDRVRWYWWVTDGEGPDDRCVKCGSMDWAWSSAVDCSECTEVS